jgi:transposase
MNTEQMSAFLSQVSAAHPQDFIVMVLDGARSHKAKELQRPENIRLFGLPPYSPELNPQEHVWMNSGRKSSPTVRISLFKPVRLNDGHAITLRKMVDVLPSLGVWVNIL